MKWNKGVYDAGTVDYRVFWNGDGLAYFGNSSDPIVWNGAYPATYLGDGWEITFGGTGMDPYILVGRPIVYMDTPNVLAEGWADARTYFLGAGKHFPEYVGFVPIRLPLLDDPGKASTNETLTNQPYTAENPKHRVVGSLAYFEIKATEYRG